MQPMTLGEVARLYDCSESTVRRLDHVLNPARTAYGVRIYDRATVEKHREAQLAKSIRGRRAA